MNEKYNSSVFIENLSASKAAEREIKFITMGIYDREFPDRVYRELGFSEAGIIALKNYLKIKDEEKNNGK